MSIISIKHIQQEIDGFNWKCGAVALEMIFSYYNIPYVESEIWENVKENRSGGIAQKYALTYKLANYSISKGLPATIYKADEATWSSILDALDEIAVPAILSIREKKSLNSHFVVFSGKKDGDYIFRDPNSNKDFNRYDYMFLRDAWKPWPKINVSGYVFVVFGNADHEVECIHCGKKYPLVLHDELNNKISICPYCDRGQFLP